MFKEGSRTLKFDGKDTTAIIEPRLNYQVLVHDFSYLWSSMKDANYWIDKLELQLHPEGAYFKETYRSKENLINKNGKLRSAATVFIF